MSDGDGVACMEFYIFEASGSSRIDSVSFSAVHGFSREQYFNLKFFTVVFTCVLCWYIL